jgi:hypothetical protein
MKLDHRLADATRMRAKDRRFGEIPKRVIAKFEVSRPPSRKHALTMHL